MPDVTLSTTSQGQPGASVLQTSYSTSRRAREEDMAPTNVINPASGIALPVSCVFSVYCLLLEANQSADSCLSSWKPCSPGKRTVLRTTLARKQQMRTSPRSLTQIPLFRLSIRACAHWSPSKRGRYRGPLQVGRSCPRRAVLPVSTRSLIPLL